MHGAVRSVAFGATWRRPLQHPGFRAVFGDSPKLTARHHYTPDADQRVAAATLAASFAQSTGVPGALSSNTETAGGSPEKPNSFQRATTCSYVSFDSFVRLEKFLICRKSMQALIRAFDPQAGFPED